MRRDAHSDRRRVRHYVSAVLGIAGESGDWEEWEEEMLVLYRVASDVAVRRSLPGLLEQWMFA